MHTTHSNTQYKNESKHSEMGPVRKNQNGTLSNPGKVRVILESKASLNSVSPASKEFALT